VADNREGADVTGSLLGSGAAPVGPELMTTAPRSGQERPAPYEDLTPDQRRIRDLEDQLAKALGSKDPQLKYEKAKSGEKILIHFLHDGFTAFGTVWFRGQEIELEMGGDAYRQTQNRQGVSWLSFRDDAAMQYKLYGREMFRSGPWPGEQSYTASEGLWEQRLDENGYPVSGPSRTELADADARERARGRGVPVEVGVRGGSY